jgi:hypothetical protein
LEKGARGDLNIALIKNPPQSPFFKGGGGLGFSMDYLGSTEK